MNRLYAIMNQGKEPDLGAWRQVSKQSRFNTDYTDKQIKPRITRKEKHGAPRKSISQSRAKRPNLLSV